MTISSEIHDAMGDYYETMATDHSIWAIVNSSDSRKTLLKVLSSLILVRSPR